MTSAMHSPVITRARVGDTDLKDIIFAVPDCGMAVDTALFKGPSIHISLEVRQLTYTNGQWQSRGKHRRTTHRGGDADQHTLTQGRGWSHASPYTANCLFISFCLEIQALHLRRARLYGTLCTLHRGSLCVKLCVPLRNFLCTPVCTSQCTMFLDGVKASLFFQGKNVSLFSALIGQLPQQRTLLMPRLTCALDHASAFRL